jgi:hypothetical protein
MSQHQQFEIMCALAAVGQLNPSDLGGLRQHAEDCADCQRRLSEFAQVSAQALMLFGERCSNNDRTPKGMTSRFVARARAEGIPLRKSAGSLPCELLHSLGGRGNIAAALLILALVAGISNRSRTPALSRAPVIAGANPTDQQVALETKPVPGRSMSRPSESKQIARRSTKRRRLGITRATVAWGHSSELGFTRLGSTPASGLFTANCDQDGVTLDFSFFARTSEANEPRLFKALATSKPTSPVTPWLISLNSLPPVFLYPADRESFPGELSPRVGISKPNIDWSRIRWGALLQSSKPNRAPQYQETPEQRWPFSNQFKIDAR